jgi:hypothetical protein
VLEAADAAPTASAKATAPIAAESTALMREPLLNDGGMRIGEFMMAPVRSL